MWGLEKNSMNSIGALTLLSFLVTLWSASILFFSFKRSIDVSGRYFLLAEFTMLLLFIQVFITNSRPDLINTRTLFMGNWVGMCSEVAVLFSIYSLTRVVKSKHYLLAIGLLALYCFFIEYSRLHIHPAMPVGLYAFLSLVLALATYFASRSQKDAELRRNQFLRWIGYLELAIAGFALIRIASYFLDVPIAPRTPTMTNTIIFAFILALSIFRYISYQSLRISWVDPRTNSENYLNQNLTKVVNEKNQLLQRLISSNRALGISALASSLTHQLSQPLTGIALMTETVKRDLIRSDQNPEAAHALNTISEQMAKLSELVINLRKLFVARDHQFSPFNLQKITTEVLEIIEPTLLSRAIVLEISFRSNPTVFGNAIQIQQVIINLMNNAMDAIANANSSSRKIILTIDQRGSNAVLVIEDRGPGLSAAVLPNLFELYKTTKPDGLGVGLWLSKTIIDQHQGSIHVSNSQIGGAIFEICIPLFEFHDRRIDQ